MKRSIFRTCLVLFAALIGTTQLAGCSGEVSFTTASLSEATMATGTDSDNQPVGATDQFQVDTPEIFCSVKLSNAPNDTEVLSEWVYVKGELEGVTDHIIDTFPVVTDGTRHLQFSMERPDGGWPKGDYKLVLYVDAKEEVAVPFTVGEVAANPFASSDSTPTLSQATMTLGVTSDSQPLNPTSTFATDTPEVFCSVLVSNVSEPVDLLSEWYYVKGEIEEASNVLIDSVPLTVPEDQYVQFSLTLPDNGWPIGEYKLVLYLNGTEELIVPFTIESTSGATSAAPISDVTMALGADDNAQPINPTSTFPAGTKKVYTTLYISPDVSAGTIFLAEWYEMQGESPSLVDSYEFDVEGDYDYYVYYEMEEGWPASEYAIILYLDGEQQAVAYFTVS